jgi:hypothetical protein
LQVTLKLYAQLDEPLLSHDLDCTAICYTGDDVLCLPRCCRALVTGVNILDPNLCTTSVARIDKYVKIR